MAVRPEGRMRRNLVIRLFALLGTKKRQLGALFAFLILALASDIVVPFVTQRLIDALVKHFTKVATMPVAFLMGAAAVILVATALARALRSVYNYRLFVLVTSLEDQIRAMIFEKYLRLHVLFHHSASSGQLIGRIERGASAIYTILFDIFGQNLLPPIFVFGGILAILAFKNIWMALALFLPLPVYVALVYRATKKIYEIEKNTMERFDEVSKESYDVASNILTVKKFYQEQAESRHQMKLLAQAREIQYGGERLWRMIENIQTFIATLGRIIIILLGGIFVLQGKSTVGEFVLYVTLHNMAYAPLSHLSHIFPRLRRNTARAEGLFEILDEPMLVLDKPNAVPLPRHERSVEFKNVSFRYACERNWVLRGVNLKIPAGKTVALVGRSGSGKTTFINLLLRSFDPEIGSVRIDGHDISACQRETLLSQIAVVPQEVDLFSRTIFENIGYGIPYAERDAIVEAAKTALAHDFILATEKGYDTVVGERGIKLSGGERQRIGIARAIVRDPSILILDEATSHLDTESERLISRATEALIRNRTTFIIAHRLSTVIHADLIVVFRGGKIEAAGTHEKLLTISKTYWRLHALQFSEKE
ncbi:MAG: hypothetical protein A3I44_02930 [Candidatus Sungbacteria bacterium RIFCSPLOWO2_02_FULL_51_17]|uniref:ABC transporter ATP-binding protein n=1 Tax=Candidatus Sungbacteria bacterium RIFCSPHIGHO2_02_FULL_51_29 TaxID=1802273 RepID=A0A1G2KPP8_9BACT|nr:MAG: hypothetical protein A3C16_00850 [Candidatus Sungbacteria bacterium RIFCSPHIGHO2_02_FULL_51_29]OHA11764.1 MAG: hypothetical protein A3I44_02930 [Candidatus Sungbacteria bacterium RIFCSPLOWO2_02_FULL_51_17]